jgi:hypothetical protein
MELLLESEDAEPVSVDEAEDDAVVAGEPGTTTPKKRTRRGTRGGRNRRTKPAGATPAEGTVVADEETELADEETPEPTVEPPAHVTPKRPPTPRGPVIHVPGPELGRDGETSENGDQPPAVKKPTRRGSRGGRNRRKKPAGATAPAAATLEPVEAAVAAETAAPPVVVEAPVSPNGRKAEDSDAWEYTPMSQWDDVDEKAS